RKQLAEVPVPEVREPLEKIAEILERYEPVLLGRLHDTVYNRAGPGSLRSVAEQPPLPAYDERLGRTLTAVVVDLKPSVPKEVLEFVPLALAVPDGLPQQALGKDLCRFPM